VYFPSLMLMALHEERVAGVERRARQPAWRWPGHGRARRRLELTARTRAGADQADFLAAGARS
jgi:hypothetical protein